MPAGGDPARQPAPSAARQSSSGSSRAMGGRRRGPGPEPGPGPARSRRCSLRCGAAGAGGAGPGSRPGPPSLPPSAAGRAPGRGRAGDGAGTGRGRPRRCFPPASGAPRSSPPARRCVGPVLKLHTPAPCPRFRHGLAFASKRARGSGGEAALTASGTRGRAKLLLKQGCASVKHPQSLTHTCPKTTPNLVPAALGQGTSLEGAQALASHCSVQGADWRDGAARHKENILCERGSICGTGDSRSC